MNRIVVGLLAALCAGGCDDGGGGPAGPCAHGAEPRLEIGAGVGGAFLSFTEGQEVGLVSAPQGGFGVTILVRTVGLLAGPEALATLRLETLVGGELVGEFTNPTQPVACTDEGGLINGIVVGFDPNRYGTNDDLLALDGQRVELRVTVTDASGRAVTQGQVVTIRAGG